MWKFFLSDYRNTSRIRKYKNIDVINTPVYYFLYDKPKDFYIIFIIIDTRRGVGIMQQFLENDKVDFITIEGNVYTHKQIEIRNGITFMRMKKRILPVNEQATA